MSAGVVLDPLALYDVHADRLFDLALTITRDRGAAAEVVRDVLAAAIVTGRAGVADRPALYARVHAEAVSGLAVRHRLPPHLRVVGLPPGLACAPTTGDLASLVWLALAAYAEQDQALLVLAMRHGLGGPALAEVLDVSDAAVTPLLRSAEQRVRRGVGALLALCRNCSPTSAADVVAGWDGTFSPLVRGRVADALVADGLLADAPDPIALLRAAPLVAAPVALRGAVADRADALRQLPPARVDTGPSLDDTIPPEHAIALPAILSPAARTWPAPAAPRPTPEPAVEAADVPTTRLTPVTNTAVQTPIRPRHRVPRVLTVGLVLAALLVVGALAARALQRPAPAARQTATMPRVTSSATAAHDLTAPPPSSGALTLPAEEVRVDPAGGGVLTLANAGRGPLEWWLVQAPTWLELERTSGTIAPGSTVAVPLHVASGVAEGDHSGPIIVARDAQPDDPLAAIATTSVERAPTLAQASFGTRALAQAGCGHDSTEMAVVATDDTGLGSVSVTVTGPAANRSARVELTDTGGAFSGVLGPFDTPGTASVTVTATDTRGNQAVADAGSLRIQPC